MTCIFTVLVALAVVLALSNTHSSETRNDGQQLQQGDQQQGREGLAEAPRRAPVSVYESSMHSGARLDVHVLPLESIARIKEDCEGDDPHPHSDEDENVICPGKGRATVVVESSVKFQKMIGFGGAFTDAATINLFKLPSEVQDKVCVCVCGVCWLCRTASFRFLFTTSKISLRTDTGVLMQVVPIP